MFKRQIKTLIILITLALLAGCTNIEKNQTSYDLLAVQKDHKLSSSPPEKRKLYLPKDQLSSDKKTDSSIAENAAFQQVGSGRFVNFKSLTDSREISTNAGGYSMNFDQVKITEFIGSVFGSTLGLNYTIDPAINGTLTVRTGAPITKSKLISHAENVLLLHNVSIITKNGFYTFIPMAKALNRSSVTKRQPGRNKPGFGIEIIPIQHVEAEEMAHILKPFSKNDAIISFDNTRNVVSISGSRIERNNIVDLIKIFDVDILSGMSFELLPLTSTNPSTIESELNTIFEQEGTENLLNGIRFVSIERLNSLLIISKNPKRLKEAKTWIKRLDIGKNADKPQLFVYKVQNTEASDLAEMLGSLFDSSYSKTGTQKSTPIAPALTSATISTSSKATNSVTPNSNILQQSGLSGGQQPANNNGTLNRSTKESGQIKIVANENTNSLFIKATAKQYDEILSTLKIIDIVPLQVMIEATIAEVTLNDELKFGIEWFFQKGNSKATFSTASNGAVTSNFPGFSYFYGAGNVSAVINALDSVTDVNILSSPQLMVLDNHKALLQIGDQVPVATQSVVNSTNPDAPTVNTIEFRDTGIVLNVVPRVNSTGLVNLDIEQEVSDVVKTTTSGIDSPTIQQRKINSSIVVQSGETVALGGLIRDKITDKENGIPLLSSMPIIGKLFGTSEDIHSRTELLILITPKVIKNQQEARDLTDELRRKINAFSSANKK